MWADTTFNTLVFFTEQGSVNARSRGPKLQREYVEQAFALARSLRDFGKPLRVFTNDKARFIALMPARAQPAVVIEQPCFVGEFPPELGFFAAHHKLQLFRVFAGERGWNCLVDVDVVANGERVNLAKALDRYPSVDGWVYDISGQVFPAFGASRVQSDLFALGATHPYPRWYGGEFIMGSPRFFAYIDEEYRRRRLRYLSLRERLHHIGDEALVSAVLNGCEAANIRIADAGPSGVVIRHWTEQTRHVQTPLAALKRSFLWHLPSSKRLVADFGRHGSHRRLYLAVAFEESVTTRWRLAKRRLAGRLRTIVDRDAVRCPMPYSLVKRALDVSAAGVALVLISPLLAAIAGAVKLSSPGPILFRQERVGLRGRRFTILKFRSMIDGAHGPAVTSRGDRRVTRAGRLLRRYKLDELPQLWNVLVGDMSLVGPRPEVERYVRFFPEAYARILTVRPGLTDFATIAYRDEEALLGASQDAETYYTSRVLPAKIRLCERYLEEMSLSTDLALILRTLAALVR